MADSQNPQTAKRLAEGKQLGGRPTKYNPEIIRQTAEYLETYEALGDLIPSIAGLAATLNVTREKVSLWASDKNKGEFSRMISMLQGEQERKLLYGGLSSKYNAGIAKLILSKHGYHDNPQANQGAGGITVNVNRRGVTVQAGGQSVTVSPEDSTPGTTLEHDAD